MSTFFKDKKDRNWDLSMNLAAAKRIDNSDFTAVHKKPFSILSPDKQIFMNLLQNTGLTCAIAWAIVQPQVKSKFKDGQWPVDPNPRPLDGETPDDHQTRLDTSEAEFMEGITGPVIVELRKALWESMADFFPEHRIVLSTLLTRFEKAQTQMNKELAGLSEEMDALVKETISMEAGNLRKKIQKLKGKTVEELRGELSNDPQLSSVGPGEISDD